MSADDGVRAIQFVIITGLSGAGKSNTIRVFEDLNFFCIDNLPPALLPKFAELCVQSDGRVGRVAVVIDTRGREFFDDLFQSLAMLEAMGFDYRILFLDAGDDVLVRRFKETRRKHPLDDGGSVLDAIRAERSRLERVKERASRIIDTSALSVRELRDEIAGEFASDGTGTLSVTVLTFGYKHGLPLDADLVLDCRFLPNPHYDPILQPLSGQSPEVRAFVLGSPQTHEFQRHLEDLLAYLLPRFVEEGKTHVTMAIGCTGGRHRSVVLGDELVAYLARLGYRARVQHRDVRKE